MPLIVMFIFGAVVVGAGAMLAPAWPTSQPRIGLNAALALGLVLGGAIFLANLGGWNTLSVDYLLFALVTAIFLFGTLSYGQRRAEARGDELLDADQGWPGPRDLLLFAFALLLFALPALLLPVPLDTDAQGFGYLGLSLKLGGQFRTLAPFHPEIQYLYSPGFIALIAYLSQQLGQGLHDVQLAVGAVLGFVLVLLAYDFGAEWQDKRLGRACALAMMAGTGLYTAFMDSHYTTLLALVFAFAFVIYSLRYLRGGWLGDAIAAGLMLGAVVLSHPDTTIILLLGYVPFLLTMWLALPRPTRRRWLIMAFGVPALAVVAISPWLINTLPLLGANIVSPFSRDLNYWQVMLLYSGILVPILALIGAIAGLRRRDAAAILVVGWLVFALDFATVGLTERLLGWLLAPILRYDYPFSIAWHAPIIPFAMLGGMGLLLLWDQLAEVRLGSLFHRLAPALLIAGSAALLLLATLSPQLLEWSKGRVGFYGAFSSEADVSAMEWLRNNAPSDARILNYPAPHEADWTAVISERDAVYYRPQPFFQNAEASLAEQERLRAFWRDPANPDHRALLETAGIDYVLVPQVVGDPASTETMWRWRSPFLEEAISQVEDAAYLQSVFDLNGAAIYVIADNT